MIARVEEGEERIDARGIGLNPFRCNQVKIYVDESNVSKQVGTEVVVDHAHGVDAVHSFQGDDNYGDRGHVASPK